MWVFRTANQLFQEIPGAITEIAKDFEFFLPKFWSSDSEQFPMKNFEPEEILTLSIKNHFDLKPLTENLG